LMAAGKGSNEIWANNYGLSPYDYCFGFLSGIEYGSYNRLNSNTVLCRLVHAQLTLFDPAAHCSHVSPGGGMACVDFTYESFYSKHY
jgi:hypothetical protein